MRILSIGGAAGPVLFATAVVVSGALRPEYSHVTQFMSELGETGGSRSYLMNYGGFIPTGLLLIGFSTRCLIPFARGHVSIFSDEHYGITRRPGNCTSLVLALSPKRDH